MTDDEVVFTHGSAMVPATPSREPPQSQSGFRSRTGRRGQSCMLAQFRPRRNSPRPMTSSKATKSFVCAGYRPVPGLVAAGLLLWLARVVASDGGRGTSASDAGDSTAFVASSAVCRTERVVDAGQAVWMDSSDCSEEEHAEWQHIMLWNPSKLPVDVSTADSEGHSMPGAVDASSSVFSSSDTFGWVTNRCPFGRCGAMRIAVGHTARRTPIARVFATSWQMSELPPTVLAVSSSREQAGAFDGHEVAFVSERSMNRGDDRSPAGAAGSPHHDMHVVENSRPDVAEHRLSNHDGLLGTTTIDHTKRILQEHGAALCRIPLEAQSWYGEVRFRSPWPPVNMTLAPTGSSMHDVWITSRFGGGWPDELSLPIGELPLPDGSPAASLAIRIQVPQDWNSGKDGCSDCSMSIWRRTTEAWQRWSSLLAEPLHFDTNGWLGLAVSRSLWPDQLGTVDGGSLAAYSECLGTSESFQADVNAVSDVWIGVLRPPRSEDEVWGIVPSIASVSLGEDHTCAIDAEGGLWCWGHGGSGRLGLGDTLNRLTPRKVLLSAPVNITYISLGRLHTCAIDDKGGLWCWGSGGMGRLGLGNSIGRSTPEKVSFSATVAVTSVSLGTSHTCAIDDKGGLWCWGSASEGQLGLGHTSTRYTPQEVSLPESVTIERVSTGADHTCATGDGGGLWCWGEGSEGQLGLNDTSNRLTPHRVVSLESVIIRSVSLGASHTCATDAEGGLWCWGYGVSGRLGLDDQEPRMTPHEVHFPTSVVIESVNLGASHTCATDAEGGLWCWGYGWMGRLGVGGGVSLLVPSKVSLLASMTMESVSLGGEHTCASDAGGSLWCWGRGRNAQLGLGDTSHHVTPQELMLWAHDTRLKLAASPACFVSPIDFRVLSTRHALNASQSCVRVMPPAASWVNDADLLTLPTGGFTEEVCVGGDWEWREVPDHGDKAMCMFNEEFDWWKYQEGVRGASDPNISQSVRQEQWFDSVELVLLNEPLDTAGGSMLQLQLHPFGDGMVALPFLVGTPFDGEVEVFVSGVICRDPVLHEWVEISCAAPPLLGPENDLNVTIHAVDQVFEFWTPEIVAYSDPHIRSLIACGWGSDLLRLMMDVGSTGLGEFHVRVGGERCANVTVESETALSCLIAVNDTARDVWFSVCGYDSPAEQLDPTATAAFADFAPRIKQVERPFSDELRVHWEIADRQGCRHDSHATHFHLHSRTGLNLVKEDVFARGDLSAESVADGWMRFSVSIATFMREPVRVSVMAINRLGEQAAGEWDQWMLVNYTFVEPPPVAVIQDVWNIPSAPNVVGVAWKVDVSWIRDNMTLPDSFDVKTTSRSGVAEIVSRVDQESAFYGSAGCDGERYVADHCHAGACECFYSAEVPAMTGSNGVEVELAARNVVGKGNASETKVLGAGVKTKLDFPSRTSRNLCPLEVNTVSWFGEVRLLVDANAVADAPVLFIVRFPESSPGEMPPVWVLEQSDSESLHGAALVLRVPSIKHENGPCDHCGVVLWRHSPEWNSSWTQLHPSLVGFVSTQSGAQRGVALPRSLWPSNVSNMSVSSVSAFLESETDCVKDDAWNPSSAASVWIGELQGPQVNPFGFAALPRVVSVGCGDTHTCTVSADGMMWCWGGNAHGELGVGDREDRRSPAIVPGTAEWNQVTLGMHHTCGISVTNALWCWGGNAHGELGVGDREDRLVPEPVARFSAEHVAAGHCHTCVTSLGGSVWCWGDNDNGQLGMGGMTRLHPARVTNAASPRATWVSAGPRHSCALFVGDSMWCWGGGLSRSFVGANVSFPSPSPSELEVDGMLSIAFGGSHACARTVGGTLACWGDNDRHQLGLNDTAARLNPAVLRSLVWSRASAVRAGSAHNCAILEGASLWCWGANDRGQLGQGFESEPIGVPHEVIDLLPPMETAAVRTTSACVLSPLDLAALGHVDLLDMSEACVGAMPPMQVWTHTTNNTDIVLSPSAMARGNCASKLLESVHDEARLGDVCAMRSAFNWFQVANNAQQWWNGHFAGPIDDDSSGLMEAVVAVEERESHLSPMGGTLLHVSFDLAPDQYANWLSLLPAIFLAEANVSVGNSECRDVVFLGWLQLACTAPGGLGVEDVTISMIAGLHVTEWKLSAAVTFAPPSIRNVVVCSWGRDAVQLSIDVGFAVDSDVVPGVFADSAVCNDVVHLGTSWISCRLDREDGIASVMFVVEGKFESGSVPVDLRARENFSSHPPTIISFRRPRSDQVRVEWDEGVRSQCDPRSRANRFTVLTEDPDERRMETVVSRDDAITDGGVFVANTATLAHEGVRISVVAFNPLGEEARTPWSGSVPVNTSLLELPPNVDLVHAWRLPGDRDEVGLVWRISPVGVADAISLPRWFSLESISARGSTTQTTVAAHRALHRAQLPSGTWERGSTCSIGYYLCEFAAIIPTGTIAPVRVAVQARNDAGSSDAVTWGTELAFNESLLVLPPRARIANAWRPVGDAGHIVVTWRYRDVALDDPRSEVSEFLLEAVAPDNSTAMTRVDRSAVFQMHMGGNRSANNPPTQWSWYSATMASGTQRPVRVRVTPVNQMGEGLPSEWPDLVTENCRDDEFLSDHLDSSSEWRCRECPAEAVCGGLSARNVTARDGFWRIPWSREGLGFIPCHSGASCRGWVGSLRALGAGASEGTHGDSNGTEHVPDGRQLSLELTSPPDGTMFLMPDDLHGRERPVAVRGLVLMSEEHERCGNGHAGVMCRMCDDGYHMDVSGTCAACGSQAWAWIRITLISIAVLLLLSIMLQRAVSQSGNRRSKGIQVLKVIATHLQTVAIVAGIGVEWPSLVRVVNTVASAGSSVTSEGLSLECVLPRSLAKDIFARTAIAVFGAVGALLLYVLIFWAFWIWWKRGNLSGWRKRVEVSLLVLAFLLHTPITTMAFKLVACESIHAPEDETNSQSRLTASLDVRCDDPDDLRRILSLFLPVFTLVSVGIPLGAAIRLLVLRDRLDEPDVAQQWGFLYIGFRPHAVLWETLVMARKVGLAAVTVVLAAQGPLVQITGTMLVTMAFLALHAWMKPYDSNQMNRLEMAALSCAALTLLVALLLVSEAEASVTVAAVVILTINLALLVWAGYMLAATAWKKGKKTAVHAGFGKGCMRNRCCRTCVRSGGGVRRLAVPPAASVAEQRWASSTMASRHASSVMVLDGAQRMMTNPINRAEQARRTLDSPRDSKTGESLEQENPGEHSAPLHPDELECSRSHRISRALSVTAAERRQQR